MIELIQMRLAKLGPEAVLVLSTSIGNDIGEMISQIASAFGRSQANLLKPCDPDIWSSEDRLSVIGSIRAEEQAQGLGIEAVVVVVEELVEVACTKEELIRHPGR